jgi:putative sterol carrier protein
MMETKTPKQFLEEILPNKFKPEKAADFDVTAQLNLTGPNGGCWILTLKNQKLKVTEGTHPSPTLTLTVADSDFMDLVNGKLKTTQAFFGGKIHLSGNLILALKLKDAGLLDFGA